VTSTLPPPDVLPPGMAFRDKPLRADVLYTMNANERWQLALQQSCAETRVRNKKTVRITPGGSVWRAGSRPMPPPAGDKYCDEAWVARSFLRACHVEQTEINEKRQRAREFDALSLRQVARMARSVDMASLVASWQYVCALRGASLAEADGWLTPAAAAEVVAEVDADLKTMAKRANMVAALQRLEIQRMGQEARAKEQYAKVERTAEAQRQAHVNTVDCLPGWFDALGDDFSEKLAAVKADKLGDWDEFNAWLRMEYDADDLDEFTFDEKEDLDIYLDFRAKRKR
jgi:hypothetical protein